MIDDGLAWAALILVAAPVGWLCMKLAGATRPWRRELVALATIIPLVAIIGTVGGLANYAVRTDMAAADFWTWSIWVGVVLSGAVSFHLIGRWHGAGSTRSEPAREAVEPQ